MKTLRTLLTAIGFCLASVSGNAAVIWDQSFSATGAWYRGTNVSWSSGYHVGETVIFGQAQDIWGMDVYARIDIGSTGFPPPPQIGQPQIGQRVVVRVYALKPGDGVYEYKPPEFEFTSAIDTIDSVGAGRYAEPVMRPPGWMAIVRMHVDFPSAASLLPNTPYIFAMMGEGSTPFFTAGMYNGSGPLIDDSFVFFRTDTCCTYQAWDMPGFGDLPFRLHDSVTAPVPEPSSYALMLAGLGLISFVAKRKHSRKK